MHAWRTRNQHSLAQERNVAVVSDSPPPPRLASYTGDHVGCGRSEEGIQGEMQIGYGACLLSYTLVQLGEVQLGENPSCLPLALHSS